MEGPPKKRHHPRPTGVSLLDCAVGGVAPGLGLVLVGETGTGRTVLCLETAAAALGRDERVVYLTGEPPEVLLRQAESLGLDLLPSLSIGRLTLLELTPNAATTTRAHGIAPLLESIESEAPHAQWLIVDPLTALTADLLDERPLRDAVGALLTGYAAQQAIVAAADTDMLRRQPALERALSDVSGSLAYLRRDDEGQRTLSVLKSRFASSSSGRLAFVITERGTEVIESAAPGATEPMGGSGQRAARPDPQGAPIRRIHVHGHEPVSDEVETDVESSLSESPDREGPEGSVESGHGSVSAHPRPAATPAPVASAGKARPRVLVVHADPVRADEIAKLLSPSYEISIEHSAFGALSAIFTQPTDLIILDFKLPDISGYEILVTLQRAPHGPAVLAVSDSLVRAADRIRALVLGAADVLPSFCASYELRHKVEQVLAAPRPPRSTLATGADAQELLAMATASSRRVDAAEFGERMRRAWRFGERVGIASSVLALETGSAEDLEVVLGACEKLLRTEDAAHAIDDRRAVVLLVAADLDRTPVVIGRLKQSIDRMVELAWGARALDDDLCAIGDWSKCMDGFTLEVW